MTNPLPQSIQDYLDQGMSPHGWMTPEKGAALAMHVLNSKPKYAVEIGVYSGRSLLAIALAMKENGSGLVHGIDPWTPTSSVEGFPEGDANHQWWKGVDHEMIMKECEGAITRLQLKKHARTWRYKSEEVCGIFNSGIEMLHIDGNHSPESALFDVTNWVPKVRSGGSVWFDDEDWLTTKPAQEKLLEMCNPVAKVGSCGVYERKP